MTTRRRRAAFAPKAGEIYSLSALARGDAQPMRKGVIHLQAGHEYWIGASSSPDHIVVSQVTEDRVCFYRGDYRTERSEMRPIADSLIRDGTATWLKTYGAHLENTTRAAAAGVAPEEIADRVALVQAVRGLLEGRPSPRKVDHRDYQRVRTVVRMRPGHAQRVTCPKCDSTQPAAAGRIVEHEAPGAGRCAGTGEWTRAGDLWYRAEQYGGVGSTNEPDGTTHYHVHGSRAEARRLLADEAFELVAGPTEDNGEGD